MNVSLHRRRHDEQRDQSWLTQAHAVVTGVWLGWASLIALGVVASEFPMLTSGLMLFAGVVTADGGIRHYRSYRRITTELHQAGCTCTPRALPGAPAPSHKRVGR